MDMLKPGSLMIAAVAMCASLAHAQTASPSGAAVVSSEPGKVAGVAVVDVTATVTAIDKATRKVTLRGPQGRSVEVVAGDEVKNFDQIRVGDNVRVQYRESLTLELRTTKGAVGATETVAGARAKPGERPAGVVGREVQIVAEVVDVDPVKSVISLKGPKGNVVDLKVQNPDHFKVVKKGDQVDAVYTEALAIAVTPATKPAK
jgi:hypothetical protein